VVIIVFAVTLAPAEVMAEGMETDDEEAMEMELVEEEAEEPADPEDVTLN
jgi:hypothetical protein